MKASDWIDINIEQPRLHTRVLVCQTFSDGSRFARFATPVKVIGDIVYYDDDGFDIDYITHWQRVVLPRRKKKL